MRALLIVFGLLSACDSGRPPAAGSSDPCHPIPPVRCESDTECAPYLCKTSFCDQKCVSSATCAKGFACNDGRCVKQGACGTCTNDYDCAGGKRCDLAKSLCL